MNDVQHLNVKIKNIKKITRKTNKTNYHNVGIPIVAYIRLYRNIMLRETTKIRLIPHFHTIFLVHITYMLFNIFSFLHYNFNSHLTY